MRYGKRRISGGVVAFMLFLMISAAATAFSMWAEVTGFSFPEINIEQPIEDKNKKKKGSR